MTRTYTDTRPAGAPAHGRDAAAAADDAFADASRHADRPPPPPPRRQKRHKLRPYKGGGIVAAPGKALAARRGHLAEVAPDSAVDAIAAGLAGGAPGAGAATSVVDGGGPVLQHVHVQLIFW